MFKVILFMLLFIAPALAKDDACITPGVAEQKLKTTATAAFGHSPNITVFVGKNLDKFINIAVDLVDDGVTKSKVSNAERVEIYIIDESPVNYVVFYKHNCVSLALKAPTKELKHIINMVNQHNANWN